MPVNVIISVCDVTLFDEVTPMAVIIAVCHIIPANDVTPVNVIIPECNVTLVDDITLVHHLYTFYVGYKSCFLIQTNKYGGQLYSDTPPAPQGRVVFSDGSVVIMIPYEFELKNTYLGTQVL